MSRAYRISVKESVHRVIKAEDSVCTQLEVLEVLPPEQMAGLLADELEKRGFKKAGERLVRTEDGVTISIDPRAMTVTVTAEGRERATAEASREGWAADDYGPHEGKVREELKKELQKELEKKLQDKKAELQGQVTDRLEGKLSDLRQELDQVVNRVTAEALKRKAAQLGQIKEMTEDPQAGSLTIVLEV